MADNPTDSHYDELDRLAARSQAARDIDAGTEARAGRPRGIWPWAVSGLLFAFALGLLGSPVFERALRDTLPPSFRSDMTGADPRIEGLLDRVARLEAEQGQLSAAPALPAASDTTGIGVRLQAIENRAAVAETNDANLLARLDALAAEVARTSSAVSETDARTRDLFLLAVARRMVEAGRPLTPIGAAIESRFRTGDGGAVDALTAWSAAPQTRRTLRSRLESIGALPETTETGSWWDRLKASLSGLVTVRGQRAGVADNRALMAQARTAMAADDVQLAVSALAAGDWPPAVDQWLQDARILLAAEEALSRLETAALETGVGDLRAAATP